MLCEFCCVWAVFECVCVASVCVGLGMISTCDESVVSCVCGVHNVATCRFGFFNHTKRRISSKTSFACSSVLFVSQAL
jgi:hypothetical protein